MKKFTAAPPVADINVTPMVDVMLVMLIIFMVITPMLSHGVSVDLVRTKNPINMADAEKEDAIVVAVTRDGNVFLGTTKTTPEQIAPKVKELILKRTDNKGKTTYVKSDRRALYKKVVEVVDNLRAAGVDQLGLMTELVEEKKGQAGAQ